MKKFLTIAILFVIIMMSALTVVNAATTDSLPDELYAIGSKYGMTSAEKVKMERYLKDNPLSDDDCNSIVALAKEADQIMKDNNTTDYKALPDDVKTQLRSLAVQAADIAGVTLDFTSDGINIYKDGKLIESITSANIGKLAYTGNATNIAIIVSAVAVIAIAATVLVKRK